MGKADQTITREKFRAKADAVDMTMRIRLATSSNLLIQVQSGEVVVSEEKVLFSAEQKGFKTRRPKRK